MCFVLGDVLGEGLPFLIQQRIFCETKFMKIVLVKEKNLRLVNYGETIEFHLKSGVLFGKNNKVNVGVVLNN